ncbi:MAG: hypothetical protein ACFFF4_08960 [Candidatus Thorarchaeota archaeon]
MKRRTRLSIEFAIWFSAVIGFVLLERAAEPFLQDDIMTGNPASLIVKISFIIMAITMSFLGAYALFDWLGIFQGSSESQQSESIDDLEV